MNEDDAFERLAAEHRAWYQHCVGYVAGATQPGLEPRGYFRALFAAALLHSYAEHLWSQMGAAMRDDGHGIAPWAAVLAACECPDLSCYHCSAVRHYHPALDALLTTLAPEQ